MKNKTESRRYLLVHQESDSLFVSFDGEALKCMEEGCDDVTGDPHWELKYKKENTIDG